MNAYARAYTTRDSYAGVLAGIETSLQIAHDPVRAQAADPRVSAWSVKDQLEHLMLTDRAILGWIDEALSAPPITVRAGHPNEIGRHILAAGSIPRGRGPSPTIAMPTGIEVERLADALEGLRARAQDSEARLDELDASLHTRPHHVLGNFTPSEWMRFLHIHHLHHERIIGDILDE